MPDYGDDLDVFDSPGDSPLFMSQGYDGHIGINVMTDPADTLDRRNCRVPSVGEGGTEAY